MELQSSGFTARRRSDRVSIAFPLEVSGVDPSGAPFSLETKTTTVSRYGCCFSLAYPLRPRQDISLRRIGTGSESAGQVVAQMGAHAEGYLYGIGTDHSCEEMWGIHFSSSFEKTLLDNSYDGIYFVNRERRITYWNGGAENITGYAAMETVGQHCFNNLLGHVDDGGHPLCSRGCPLSSAMADGEPRQAHVYLRHKNGHRIPISVRVLPMRNDAGVVVGAVEVFTDATAREWAEQRVSELENLAFRDPVTNLANRRYAEMKLEHALEDHQKFGREYGVLLIDLDRFKLVNDTHGHDTGDSVLRAVAETMGRALRPGDLVGRWGGDEFLILLPDVNALGLGDLAERCRALIAQSSVTRGSSRISVTSSIGATLLNQADSAETAVRRADELMYESKSSGGDRTTAG